MTLGEAATADSPSTDETELRTADDAKSTDPTASRLARTPRIAITEAPRLPDDEMVVWTPQSLLEAAVSDPEASREAVQNTTESEIAEIDPAPGVDAVENLVTEEEEVSDPDPDRVDWQYPSNDERGERLPSPAIRVVLPLFIIEGKLTEPTPGTDEVDERMAFDVEDSEPTPAATKLPKHNLDESADMEAEQDREADP